MSFISISRLVLVVLRSDPRILHSQSVGVSSVTGDGIAEFFQAVEASREEYERSILLPRVLSRPFDLLDPLYREYLPELARVRAQREATLQKQKDDSTARMMADLAVDRASDPNFAARDGWNPDEEDEEDDGGELNIIDKSASITGYSTFPSAFRMSRHSVNSKGITRRHGVQQDSTWPFRYIPFWLPWGWSNCGMLAWKPWTE